MTTVTDALARSLADGLECGVLLPGDAGYDEARRVWNALVDRRPQLIARCAGTADVAAAVRFAREHDLEIGVCCGGHSVLGLSVPQSGLMIDLTSMGGVRVDPEARRAWVQGRAPARRTRSRRDGTRPHHDRGQRVPTPASAG
jgi:hypothetical protein